MLILREAFLGLTRFAGFQQRLSTSRNILSQRLAHLVKHGVLQRVRYSEHPPRCEYRLIAKGRDPWPLLTAINQWGGRYAAPTGPPLQVVHKGCGKAADAVVTCSDCGEYLTPPDVMAAPGPGDLDNLLRAQRSLLFRTDRGACVAARRSHPSCRTPADSRALAGSAVRWRMRALPGPDHTGFMTNQAATLT